MHIDTAEDSECHADKHGKIFDIINNSLVQFRKDFNISVELNYGFSCESKECCGKTLHISCVKKKKNMRSFCSNQKSTLLKSEHNVWLENFYKVSMLRL